ncbi:cell division cycle protein 20 homolog [Amphiura filiformis]|uniref:cell division cycle protein 20 homolog n=1 Tax=Amphiura filiformis TaxID=82378 RepID=UPI003B21494F
MAHMQFDAAIDDLVKLDGPLQKGPVPRWQRKAKENSDARPIATTPRRRAMLRSLGKTPKTPTTSQPTGLSTGGGRTPGRMSPGNNNRKILGKKPESNAAASQLVGDRFIPNRALMDLDMGNHLLAGGEDGEELDENNKVASVSQQKYQQAMKDRLGDGKEAKILTFKQRAPKAQEGHFNNLKVLYSASKTDPGKGACHRYIPTVADRILDAPYLLDDFYLTLLDWGPSNFAAVALNDEIYLWNAQDGSIDCLLELDDEDTYISCVSWIQQGCILAIGSSDGTVQLWDVEQKKNLRTMTGHASRVGALAWNEYVLSSGSRTGKIHHHDVRIQNHHTTTLDNHTQEVCGLKWSPDGKYLASGGNDNVLNIWEYGANVPLFNLTQHQAAVKALAWCPWQANVLASGGGTADRTMYFWNASTGNSLNHVDTGSQVSCILWSEAHKELISGHGYAQFQLTIWKYPTLAKLCNLRGHSSRVLSMCLSPDKTTVMSCAGDETIRLWKCFMNEKKTTKTVKKSSKSMSSTLSNMHIR